jgi:glycosidase
MPIAACFRPLAILALGLLLAGPVPAQATVPTPGTLGTGDPTRPDPPVAPAARPATPATKPAAARGARGALAPLPRDWQRGAFIEVYVRAWRDSDGDGIGDLRGLTASLDYLQALGVRGIWLMPITASQDHDHGYATRDYRAIEPAYGSLADFDALLRAAHARGIGVIMDYVVNHSAAEHPYFQQALKDRNSPYRSWYVWRDVAPTGWKVWDKDPWNRTPTGAYLSVFSPTMPDFDFHEPKVMAFHQRNLRFWLDRGIDGFRFDAVAHLVENGPQAWRDQPENKPLVRALRKTIQAYPNRFLVCEVTRDERAFALPDVCGNAFAFSRSGDFIAAARGDAEAVRKLADDFRGAPPGLASMLANHDRFAGDRVWDQLGGDLPRYKLAAASYLLQPGTPFIYYGEEIGMAQAALPGDRALRTPMSWNADPRTAGFTTGTPFRELSANRATQNVAAEEARPDGLLAWYRALLRLRNAHPALSVGDWTAPRVAGRVLAYQRRAGKERALVVLNYGDATSFDLEGLPARTRYRLAFPAGVDQVIGGDTAGRAQLLLPPQSVRVYIATD